MFFDIIPGGILKGITCLRAGGIFGCPLDYNSVVTTNEKLLLTGILGSVSGEISVEIKK